MSAVRRATPEITTRDEEAMRSRAQNEAPAGSQPPSVSYERNVSSAEVTAARIPVPVGSLVAGKYLVEGVIGAGGMGIVLAAKHVQLDRKVAVKFLLPQAASNEEAAGRFSREARAMARLQNEHVVRVLDVGELETGEPYMVMEYLEGTDISRFMKERGRLSVDATVDFMLQACEAIAEAHAVGIVHRDLKPSNIFLARRFDGSYIVKLLDFGIAKLQADASEAQQSFTTTTALLGSPVYMSPEQLQCSRDADARADIWSLGAIMHKVLAGRPPFIAETMPQVCTLIMSAPPQRLRDVRPDVPVAIEGVILKCLEKRPEDRFQNVTELAAALSAVAPAQSVGSLDRVRAAMAAGAAAPPPSAPSGPSVDGLPYGPAPSGQPISSFPIESFSAIVRNPTAGRNVVFALAAGIAVGCAATLWFALRTHGSDASASPVDTAATATAGSSSAPPPPTDTGFAAPPGTGADPPAPPVASPVPTATLAPPSPKPAAASPPVLHRPPQHPKPSSGDNSEFGGRK